MNKRKWLTLLATLPIILIVAAGIFLWTNPPAAPLPEALAAMQPDAQVRVEEQPWLVFSPAQAQTGTGFIIYPGGRVDYRAYAPLARQIAEQGYFVALLKMPLGLAVLDADAATAVIAAYPQIERWAIGGHSLGGAMAASFASQNPNTIDGLVLWAAYPSDQEDLSFLDLSVASISGSLDGLATQEDIAGSRTRLPVTATWIEIIGGNHAQFGWYGDQVGDNPAEISRAEQQKQIVAATLELLNNLP